MEIAHNNEINILKHVLENPTKAKYVSLKAGNRGAL